MSSPWYGLRGLKSILVHPASAQLPGRISVSAVVALPRLIQQGASRQGAAALERLLPASATTVWLLEAGNRQHGRWALEQLRADPQMLRGLLRRELLAQSGRDSQPEKLARSRTLSGMDDRDPVQMLSLLRRLIAQLPDQQHATDFHDRLHRLLCERSSMPFLDLQDTQRQLQSLCTQGVLAEDQAAPWESAGEQTRVLRPGPSDDRWVLSSRVARKLVVDRAGLLVAEAGVEQAALHRFPDLPAMERWLRHELTWPQRDGHSSELERYPGRWPSQIEPLRGKLHLPPLGGLGELYSWQAVFGAASAPPEAASDDDLVARADQALSAHPPSDWLPGATAAFSAPWEDDQACAPVELLSSIRLYQQGHLVHLGAEPQLHRMLHEPSGLRLHRPCNPFSAPPAAMSRPRPREL